MKNIKHLFLPFFFLFLAIGMLSGCSSRKALPPASKEVTVTKEVKVIERDTTFITQKDSSYYKALLECQEGKVVIKKVVDQKAGNHLKAPEVKIEDNYLLADCAAVAQELFYKWQEKYISEHKAEVVKEPYPVPAELSGWQLCLMWIGGITLLSAIIVLLAFLYNPFKSVTKNGK